MGVRVRKGVLRLELLLLRLLLLLLLRLLLLVELLLILLRDLRHRRDARLEGLLLLLRLWLWVLVAHTLVVPSLSGEIKRR